MIEEVLPKARPIGTANSNLDGGTDGEQMFAYLLASNLTEK